MSTADTASQFSEADHPPPTTTHTTHRFTCLSCQVAFATAESQRDHMRTDWHRYNLKRKAAELPPVTALVFAQKLQDQKLRAAQEAERAQFTAECVPCGKTYATENAYKSHLASKKHRDAAARFEAAEAKRAAEATESAKTGTNDDDDDDDDEDARQPEPRINWHERLARAATEEEFEAVMRDKMAASRPLAESECLFCPHAAESFEENLSHMAKAHSFFIPDIEYLVDIKGLIKYLGDKVAIANVCIYCNGKGRTLHSTEAVQNHMISKGHCKMIYEDGAEDEYVDFYDFSLAYAADDDAAAGDDDMDAEEEIVSGDDDDEGWEDDDGTTRRQRPKKQPYISADETELVLPSGVRIGHRMFRTYWKQNLRSTEIVPGSMRDPEMMRRMTGQYKLLGYTNPQSMSAVLAVRRKQQEHRERHEQSRKQQRREYEFRTKIGFVANNQKHFVDPNRPT
ncbi:pre-60S factor rei1 [Polyrhizophydium stewartii]|uniref:Pre-60S factor rei1 n=1 Tax=Polyrhizophydium stewartii TaxID=2732419 RepID=A0ABR4N8F1_9FUNG